MNYEFVIVQEASEEIIREFHKGLARDLIENYGADTMIEVLYALKNKSLNIDIFSREGD